MNKHSTLRSTAKSFSFTIIMLMIGVGLAALNPINVRSQFSQIITRISVNESGVQADNASTRNSIDEDGSHTAFTSLASNLVDDDTNGYADIFVYNSTTGSMTRVSVDSAGNQSDNSSDSPSISANGNYVAFQSAATDLVASDNNGVVDIFVRDIQGETTERVSVHSDTTEGNNHSLYPSISDDGRYVVYQSMATNLIDSDTNSVTDIFLHDRNTDSTTRVSVDSIDTEANNRSIYPAISGDGQFVTFSSIATNLVASDTNGVSDVFLRNLNTDATTRVSIHTDGTEADDLSTHQSIDYYGRYIAFESEATNLIDNDTNQYRDVFVRDTDLNVTSRVSVSTGGAEGDHISGDTTDNPNSRISANGQYVAFKSRASNLVPGDSNGIVDVFVHDRQTGHTTRVSTDSLGTEANNASYYPSISNDGRYIGFYSYSNNLVSGDTNGVGDVFVYDRDSLTPTLTPTPTAAISTTPTPTPSTLSVTLAKNTDTPTEVTIATSEGDVYVRCENVTTGGDLTVQVYQTPPGQLTSDFNVLPTNYDLSTSSVVCDYITVCLPYDTAEVTEVGLTEPDLELWHYLNRWENVTTSVDTVNDRACGVVEELSPFVIGVNNAVTPTPTPTSQASSQTPSELPNSGITTPTLLLILGAIGVLGGGFYLMVSPKKR